MSKLPWPEPKEGDFIIENFIFQVGKSLPKLKIHYRTLGSPKKDSNGKATNAILIMHGTTGNSSNFFRLDFAGKLFNRGQLLDANENFIVLVDGIGHGGSSKPSDGRRAHFPKYGYSDMVRADYMLLTEHLGVNHLRLVMGTSMGGSKYISVMTSHS
jgi:homoserine O-acetyltransferase